MPSPLKQVSKHRFIDGVNTVTAREYVKPTQAAYMLNCVSMSTAKGDVGVITNPKGNVLIDILLPDGRNKTIGWSKDEERNRFYYFVWNENGFHSIFRYDGLSNEIVLVMQSITDTGGVDIFNWKEKDLILMADVVRGSLLYWVKNGNDAAKINIDKALEKGDSGYGDIILKEFVNAYKLAPIVAPVAQYFSDTSVAVNKWYGTLAKFAVRYIYDDGEISQWSDFSDVPVPSKEAFTGANFVPTENNRMDITIPTGSRIVVQMEIAMLYTIDTGYSAWVSIAIIDKKDLGIGDNSLYVFRFYNDASYSAIDQSKIIRPFSFLPKAPLLQAFTKNAMVYGNFNAGFESVEIDMGYDEIIYSDLFLDDSISNELNSPNILVQTEGSSYDDYIGAGESVTKLEGNIVVLQIPPGKPTRARRFRMTIGSDVKSGNKFNVRFTNGFDDYSLSYTANSTDTAESVLNKLKQQLFNTGRILRKSPDLAGVDPSVNNNSSGNYSFLFIIYATPDKQYLNASYSVNPVNTITLKDTGQSLSNMKLGAATKYGIVYEDADGRRSPTYTDLNLVVRTDTQNDLGGIKKPEIILNINHKPPVWAVKYQIVRTADLTYANYIQMLVQKVIEVISTDNDSGEYLDLLVGSLYTYQKIHPNSILKYEFKKGDRIRFISEFETDSTGVYYPFLEVEILEFNDVVESEVNSNLTTTGTDIITVKDAIEDNIGKFIRVEGIEREILEAPSSTTYRVNSNIGDSTEKTYLTYTLIDRRGSVRIRKPSIEIKDKSLVEIFTPAYSSELISKQFFFFNKKFDILNAGLDTRLHFGDVQAQTDTLPAKISITEGTSYVRSREMPITNNKPAQVIISKIEDPSFSDFYFSLINDNGKVSVEDDGSGVVHFGSRLVFSNNYIEDTRINGLNDFDNLDRVDYNDKYGDGRLLVFTEQQLLFFKELKTGIIPVFQTIIQDNAGTELLGTSNKLLNEVRYYAEQGGIGDAPESYCSNGNRHYFISVNMGVLFRIGGDGLTPVSEIYYFDNTMRDILAEAYQNGAQIFTQWDPYLSAVIVCIGAFKKFTFRDDFNNYSWKLLSDELPSGALIEVLTPPAHGTINFVGSTANVIPNEDDYVGKDSFTYRVFVNGEWVNKKVCITYNPLANREKAWRPRFFDAVCEMEEGIMNGNLVFINLEEYFVDNGALTGIVKANTVGDPDYAPKIQDLTTCPFTGTVYQNVETTVYATRNNCPSGQVPSAPVPFVVPVGMFTSIISQANADAKALNYANANRQANANSFGTCSPVALIGNSYQSKNFRPVCGGGQIGVAYLESRAANTFFASTLVAANDLAMADINAVGQTNANANGTCVAPSYFTFKVVMYSDYTNARYNPLDSRGISWEFSNGSGYSYNLSAILTNVEITRNGIERTFNVPFAGPTIPLNAVKCYLSLLASKGITSVTEQLFHNDTLVGVPTLSVPAGGVGFQYVNTIPTAISVTLNSSSVLKVVHGTAPVITYYSAIKSGSATKNNCSGGGGSTETLTTTLGQFTSTISQIDADNKAQAYVDANKQAYANTVGTCVYTYKTYKRTSPCNLSDNVIVNLYIEQSDLDNLPSVPENVITATGIFLYKDFLRTIKADAGYYYGLLENRVFAVNINGEVTNYEICPDFKGIISMSVRSASGYFDRVRAFVDPVWIGSSVIVTGRIDTDPIAITPNGKNFSITVPAGTANGYDDTINLLIIDGETYYWQSVIASPTGFTIDTPPIII